MFITILPYIPQNKIKDGTMATYFIESASLKPCYMVLILNFSMKNFEIFRVEVSKNVKQKSPSLHQHTIFDPGLKLKLGEFETLHHHPQIKVLAGKLKF